MMSGAIPSTPTRYWSTPTSKEPLVPPPARTNAVGPGRGSGSIEGLWHRPRRAPTTTLSRRPPAVTTSTREPARAGVLAHSERGTTQRSTATATPLGSSPRGQRRHEVGDGRARAEPRPARRSRGARAPSCRRQRLDQRRHRPAPDEVDDRGRGERRQEDAVAVVADGRDDAVAGRSSRCAACCRAWRAAGRWPPRAARARRRRARWPARRTAARAPHPPAPRCRCPAPRPWRPRRPSRPRRGTRYTERPCTRPRTVRASRGTGVGGVGRPEAQDVPLDGAERGEPARRPARRWRRGPSRPPGRRGPGRGGGRPPGRARARPPARPRVPSTNVTPPRRQASIERAEERAVVDLVVARDLDAAAQGRAERGHEAAALAGTAAVGLEAERVLVGEEVVEAGAIGRIERDRHRARRVVADGVTGGALQRGGEGGPVAGALEQERGQGGFAELRLGDRGQHPGRHPRRAVAARGAGATTVTS